MTVLTEKNGPGKFIASEANGSLSRDVVTIDTGELLAGTVLGKITASGKYVQVDLAAVDGSEEAVAVLYDDADASAADVEAVAITRLAEVNDAYLVYPDGASANDIAAINAALLANSIIVVRT